MDNLEFREFGKQMIDFIADYFATIEQRAIKPSVKPGFLLKKLPTSAPKEGEDFSQIFDDYEKHVLPGICGWNSPNFHAYFPASISYPSILGELMAAATGGVGFEWSVNPSYTELEIVVTEWLGKMLGLPKEFLATDPCQGKDGKRGGGVVQGAASESVVVAMLAARKAALDRLQEQYPNESEASLMGKLVAYSSILSHSSIEKATLVCYNKLRLIETDDQGVLDSDLLSRTIKEDVESGLCPFFFCANLGTTMVCSFDNLEEIGPICQQWNMWLHVDAAYAGTFFVCPEFRTYLKGIEFADSFNFNAHKLMLTNFDCSPFWVKDRNLLMNALSVERSYFTNDDTGVVTDFRKWQIPLGRRFRALKLWFVLRSYGQKGVQRHVREHLQRTKLFEDLMAVDSRFEFWPRTPNLGLVCFRLKGPDKLTKMLSDRISNSGKIALSTVVFKNKTIIRFHGGLGNDKHVRYAWNVIQNETDRLLIKPNISSRDRVSYRDSPVYCCQLFINCSYSLE